MKRILVVPDCHHPFVDELAWALFLKCAKAWKPDYCVIIGDFADFFSVSFHTKSPAVRYDLESEVNATVDALEDLTSALPKKCKRIFCAGNHEFRLERYLSEKAPELFNTVSIPKVLQLKEHGWKYVPYKETHRIGQIHFTHDLGRSGKHAAAQSLADFGDNIVIGHTHRGNVVYGGTVSGKTHVGMSVGWLGDTDDIDYMHKAKVNRDWQHGFGTIHMEPNGTGHAQFIPIVNQRCVVDGKLYKL